MTADRPATEPQTWERLAEAAQGAAPLTDAKPKCLRCGAAWVHRDDYAGLGTPHPYEPSEGAAPRAEGLAVERLLDHVMELVEQYHSGHSVAGAPCKCDQCRELRVVRREYARLSRPSDERVPESEEDR